jgi:maleate isomerase
VPSAQAVFIGGNALRAIGVIAALEEDLRRPVLTANQVSLWVCAACSWRGSQIDNFGQLFKGRRLTVQLCLENVSELAAPT